MSRSKKHRNKSLRDICREMYGDEFIVLYDMVNSGTPIGGLAETISFIEMVERAKNKDGGANDAAD